MARQATGNVRVRELRNGRRVFWLRYRALGRRWNQRLGLDVEGWNEQRAQVELDKILDRVERRTWRPPARPRTQPADLDPTFHEYASGWLARHAPKLGQRTREDYEWRLRVHLLPFLSAHHLSEIDVTAVDTYREAKVSERAELRADGGTGGLSNDSINATVALLALILDEAAERGYDVVTPNPAKGRRRRLKTQRARRSFLEPDQAAALLDAAGRLDAKIALDWPAVLEIRASRQTGTELSERFGVSDTMISRVRRGLAWRTPTARPLRRAIVATLLLAGTRIGEACALTVADLDLPNRRLLIRDAKTAAGRRQIVLSDLLIAEIEAYLEKVGSPAPGAPLFANSDGDHFTVNGLRRTIVGPTVELARELLPSMPEKVTPHTLRRTYISLLLAGGADVPWVMAQVGHTDPKVTLQIYAQVIQSRQRDYGARVDEMVSGAVIGVPIGAARDFAAGSTSGASSVKMAEDQ